MLKQRHLRALRGRWMATRPLKSPKAVPYFARCPRKDAAAVLGVLQTGVKESPPCLTEARLSEAYPTTSLDLQQPAAPALPLAWPVERTNRTSH